MNNFGRNQKIALAALAIPYVTATVAFFLERATFAEWSGFSQVLISSVVGITLGAAALVKGARAFGKDSKPQPQPPKEE